MIVTKTKSPKRDIQGVLLLDKPLHITSNAALQIIKRIFAAQKAGHTGSLDPLASGMLPICFGEATKFSQYLFDADKTYQVSAQLGVTTSTGDGEGEIVAENPIPTALDLEQLTAVLNNFLGAIDQIPPMHSALKYHGKPLYKLARRGVTIDRPARKIFIYAINNIVFQNDILSFEVTCSKGTYIRTLIEDIGLALGCGAHVRALRRLSITGFEYHAMITLDNLTNGAVLTTLDMHLLPMECLIPQTWQKIIIHDPDQIKAIFNGRYCQIPQELELTAGLVQLFAMNQFIGIGEVLPDGRIFPRRLIRQLESTRRS